MESSNLVKSGSSRPVQYVPDFMISCCPYVLSLSPGDKPGKLLLCFRYGTMFCIRKVDGGKIFSLCNTVDTNLLNKGAWLGVVKGS